MGFHSLVADWFASRFPCATDVQLRAWPTIESGRDVLISAPTGSGKTLAAFLGCLDRLVRGASDAPLDDAVDVLYISPLKALSTDVRRNLEVPLSEIAELARDRGQSLAPIRAMVRTGDTTPRERETMRRQPPHVLVTTPESLFILLTAVRGREALRTVRTVIVDEIHAVVDDKRGAHLALSLARLDDLVTRGGGRRPQRVGLSATVQPIDLVAQFLAPRDHDEAPAPVDIVDSGHRRAMELAVEVPRDELGAVASAEMWNEIYDRLAELVRSHRTTLVFVNTRRLAERVAHHLGARIGADAVLAHHGSLSRPLRQAAEERLKRGELRAVVATASLELGIDIGSVDLVCQIGSPRSIGVTLQRIGRSGHQVEPASIPKGRVFATTRDELIECAALVRAMRRGKLDQLEIPSAPLDVLAQHIVAATACDDWSESDLYRLARGTFSYRALDRADFDAVVTMLAEGIASRRGRSGAYLLRDQVHGIVRARRGARLAAITSGGAIPENASYYVIAEPDEAIVGTLDEDFAIESLAGDIFLLGTTSWRIKRVESGRVRVENAHGAPPTIPFWRGEAPGRTAELSEQVSRLREDVWVRLTASAKAPAGLAEASRRRKPDPTTDRREPDPTRDAVAQGFGSAPGTRVEPAVSFLEHECGLNRRGAEQLAEYVARGATALGALPSQTTVVAERFFDEGGGMQLVLHAPFGARINRAWGLALRKRFCRSFNFELQAAATDNGIIISLSDQHSFPLELVYRFLRPETVEEVLTQALLDAPMFTARWRWNACRALAVLRFANGKKVPAPIQRMRSDDLLASVFPDQVACAENLVGEIRIPDHPLVSETIRDCLHEAMDIDGLKALLKGIDEGQVRTVAIDTVEPSPFSHEILNANPYAYLDDAPLEERRARAVLARRGIGGETGTIADLDPDAIARVESEAWPMVRDPNELHDALQTLGVTPRIAEWEEFFGVLALTGRATTLRVGDRHLWVAAERLSLVRVVYSDFVLDPPIRGAAEREWSTDEATAAMVCGWLDSTGPRTARELADLLAVPTDRIDAALVVLESQGVILRGRFRTAGRTSSAPTTSAGEVEWCNRRLLARIHRLTIGRLRHEIEPVTAAEFVAFLYKWQHLAPGTQLHGVEGTLQIIRQLQGYEVRAGAWESQVLRRRVTGYRPDVLDRLCLSGELMWGRVRPRRPGDVDALDLPDAELRPRGRPRMRPTRAAPIAIFRRDDRDWLLPLDGRDGEHESEGNLSALAADVETMLSRRGALFAGELARERNCSVRSIEDALWELVADGRVTADGFENLRMLLTPAARRRHTRRAQFAAGRWSLVGFGSAAQGDRVESIARQLLRRWGVMVRDLLAREVIAPAWRDLLVVFRRLEARGEVRGGRFVSGFVGEQFALPEAVELLRDVRRSGAGTDAVTVASADPLNLAGIILPGPRVHAQATTVVTLG